MTTYAASRAWSGWVNACSRSGLSSLSSPMKRLNRDWGERLRTNARSSSMSLARIGRSVAALPSGSVQFSTISGGGATATAQGAVNPASSIALRNCAAPARAGS